MTHDDHAVTEPTREVPIEDIEVFVNKHRCPPTPQLLALVEEVGEFSEAINTKASDDEVAEELADIIFVAISLGILYEVDVVSELHEVAQENLRKNADTQGNKVTKE